jgi:hypothetical protein
MDEFERRPKVQDERQTSLQIPKTSEPSLTLQHQIANQNRFWQLKAVDSMILQRFLEYGVWLKRSTGEVADGSAYSRAEASGRGESASAQHSAHSRAEAPGRGGSASARAEERFRVGKRGGTDVCAQGRPPSQAGAEDD